MPELPEVETVARGLQISVAGRRILSVTLRKTDFIDDPGAIERELPGRTIAKVERFGKFMLLRLIPSANASQLTWRGRRKPIFAGASRASWYDRKSRSPLCRPAPRKTHPRHVRPR